MVIDIEIQRTAKVAPPDTEQSITHVAGTRPDGSAWKLTEAQAIACIESRKYTFHVITEGRREPVIIGCHRGRKYLRTVTDRDTPGSLLRLPDCE